MIARYLLLSASLFMLCACGYSFQGDVSNLPQDIQTLYIPLVKNNSTTTALSPQFTDMLKREFSRYGKLKVLNEPDLADAILNVTIDRVESSVSAVSGINDTEIESDIYVNVSAVLKRRNGQRLWEVRSMSASDTYAASKQTVPLTGSQFMRGGIDAKSVSTLTQREVARGQAKETLERLMQELARKIYLDAVASDF